MTSTHLHKNLFNRTHTESFISRALILLWSQWYYMSLNAHCPLRSHFQVTTDGDGRSSIYIDSCIVLHTLILLCFQLPWISWYLHFQKCIITAMLLFGRDGSSFLDMLPRKKASCVYGQPHCWHVASVRVYIGNHVRYKCITAVGLMSIYSSSWCTFLYILKGWPNPMLILRVYLK